VAGLVELTLLNDSSCTKCYDVNVHKTILNRFGITLAAEKTLDVSDDEGKALIEKYGITLVPTMIISQDASAYPLFTPVWATVGSVEDDGVYVFRKPDVMKVPYKDLSTGEVLGLASQVAQVQAQ